MTAVTIATILKAAAVIIGFFGALFGWFRVRRIIKDRVRIKELETANKGWVEADDLIAKAQDARRNAAGHGPERVPVKQYRRPES